MKKEDITGIKYGRLTALEYAGVSKGKQTLWKCKCDCGKFIIVHKQNLKNGHTISCGCYNSEIASKKSKVHGVRKTRLYNIWHDMLNRCYKENHRCYKNYGKRGIQVCDEWRNNVLNFYDWSIKNGYKENLTLDRIDNDKGYSPDNCRWVTIIQQANNTSRNLFFTIDGKTETLANWCRIYNADYKLVHSRIYRKKWDILRALTQPKQIHKKTEK